MDLYTAAREDLATRTDAELNELLATDRTGLVIEELHGRAAADYRVHLDVHGARPQPARTYAEIMAQPNS